MPFVGDVGCSTKTATWFPVHPERLPERLSLSRGSPQPELLDGGPGHLKAATDLGETSGSPATPGPPGYSPCWLENALGEIFALFRTGEGLTQWTRGTLFRVLYHPL